MFSLVHAWINGWANNGEAGDLRRYHTHYDVTAMGPVVSYVRLITKIKMAGYMRTCVAEAG